MGEIPVPRQRSRASTEVLVMLGLMAIVFPYLGAFKGGLELGYGNYRLGATLIFLATVGQFGLPFVLLSWLFN
jgi:hypothetical protein